MIDKGEAPDRDRAKHRTGTGRSTGQGRDGAPDRDGAEYRTGTGRSAGPGQGGAPGAAGGAVAPQRRAEVRTSAAAIAVVAGMARTRPMEETRVRTTSSAISPAMSVSASPRS